MFGLGVITLIVSGIVSMFMIGLFIHDVLYKKYYEFTGFDIATLIIVMVPLVNLVFFGVFLCKEFQD